MHTLIEQHRKDAFLLFYVHYCSIMPPPKPLKKRWIIFNHSIKTCFCCFLTSLSPLKENFSHKHIFCVNFEVREFTTKQSDNKYFIYFHSFLNCEYRTKRCRRLGTHPASQINITLLLTNNVQRIYAVCNI